MTAVHCQPVREVALGGSDAGQSADAAAQRDVLVEGVVQVAGHDDLRRLAQAGVRRPDVHQIPELPAHEPAEEVHLRLVQLEIVPLVNVSRSSEGVGVRRIDSPLIEIAKIRKDPEVQISMFGVGDLESSGGRVSAERLTCLFRRGDVCDQQHEPPDMDSQRGLRRKGAADWRCKSGSVHVTGAPACLRRVSNELQAEDSDRSRARPTEYRGTLRKTPPGWRRWLSRGR
jgi:hypothetical protein